MTNRKKKTFMILVLVLAVGLYLSDQKEQTAIQNNSNEIVDVIIIDQAKHNAVLKEQAEALANRDPIIIDIENAVNNDKITTATTLRDVQLNTDAKKADSKIAMIYLKWDRKNDPAQTKKMLQMYSARLANEIGKHKNVSEIVIFWQVPYHLEDSNIAKFNYARKNNEITVGAEWFAPVIR